MVRAKVFLLESSLRILPPVAGLNYKLTKVLILDLYYNY